MPAKKPDTRTSLDHDETFEVKPLSDEARLPQKGALMPERPRDGTAEASDIHELARRAVESGEDPEAPLNFDPPEGDEPEPDRAPDDEETERTKPE